MKKLLTLALVLTFSIPQLGMADFSATQEIGYSIQVSGDIQVQDEKFHGTAPSGSKLSLSQTVAYFVDVSGRMGKNTEPEVSPTPPPSSGGSGSSGGGSYYGGNSGSENTDSKTDKDTTNTNPEETVKEEIISKQPQQETKEKNEEVLHASPEKNQEKTELPALIQKQENELNTKREQIIQKIQQRRKEVQQELAKEKEIHTIQVEQIFYSQTETKEDSQELIESFHAASYDFPDYKKSILPLYLFIIALLGLVITTLKYSSYAQLKNTFTLHKINNRDS